MINPVYIQTSSTQYKSYGPNAPVFDMDIRNQTVAGKLWSDVGNFTESTKDLRITFGVLTNREINVQAVYCTDLYAEQIAAEHAANDTSGFFTTEFENDGGSPWICPNLTSIQLQNDPWNYKGAEGSKIIMLVVPCQFAQDWDNEYGTLPSYADKNGKQICSTPEQSAEAVSKSNYGIFSKLMTTNFNTENK